MSVITVSSLTFAYEGSYDNIFENVSFQIDTDWRLGFTGRNGRGKTTFLHLLMGDYEYKGSISSSVSFAYFPYEVKDREKMAIEVVEEIYPDYELWKLNKELKQLSVEEDTLYRPFGTLSHGEQTKVLLAVLFLKENQFLLIDEPTNHLDVQGREIVGDYLNSKKGFILVSHDRSFLDRCIDHILSINKTDIQIQKGNFSSWYQNKKWQDEFELRENEKLKKDIKRLESAARQSGNWADKVEATKIGRKSPKQETHIGTRAYIGEKSRRMQQRRKNLEARQEKAIRDKEGLLKNIERADGLKLYPLTYSKERLLSFRDVSIAYGDVPVCQNVSFSVERGERIVLQGKNGCGKSSILKAILGAPIPVSGTMEIGSNLKISYVSQDASGLKGTLTDYAEAYQIDESLFKALLTKLDLSRIQFEKNLEEFSEGQKKKVLIARSLLEQAHLYIWDEPLNYIDVLSRMQIEELILTWQPTLLFVEHDTAFTEAIATQIVTF